MVLSSINCPCLCKRMTKSASARLGFKVSVLIYEFYTWLPCRGVGQNQIIAKATAMELA